MDSSTLDPLKVAAECSKFYSWQTPAACTLHHNEMHEVFKIVLAGVELYLKIYRQGIRTEKEISVEVDFTNYLFEKKLPVATALANHSGHYVQTFSTPDGERYGVVWKGVAGKPLRTSEVSETEIRALAKLVARCHKESRLKMKNFGRETFSIQKIISDISGSLGNERFSGQFRDTVKAGLQMASTRGFCSLTADVICHADPHFLNVLVDGTDLTLFDFDLCMPAPRVYDIAVFAQSRIQFGLSTSEGETQTQWFLDEYVKHEPLSVQEINAIPQYALARGLWVASQLPQIIGSLTADDAGALLANMTGMLNERMKACRGI